MESYLKELICMLLLLEYGYTSLPIETNCDGTTSTCETASLCQEGWTYRFRRCYKTISTGASYNEAQSMCNIEKGYLPVIINSDEQSFIRSAEGNSKWIGFNDKISDGTFMWDDEYKQSTDYTSWRSFEPSGGAEDCTEAPYNSGWNDIQCTHSRYAICEMDLTPRHWYPRGTSMYLFNTVEQTWIYARDSCEDVGAHLVVIGDDSEYEFVRITVGTGAHAWIGLNDYESEGNYVWPDSGEMAYYTYYYPGEPNDGVGVTGTQDAVYIGYNTLYMDDAIIDLNEQSVCEKGIEWEYFNGKRYFATDYRLSASGAIARCKDIGGDLAVITSYEENMFLFNMIRKKHLLNHGFYFGYVSDSNAVWSWPDSSDTVYSNWREGEGNQASGCAKLSLSDAQWVDNNCSPTLGFICEADIPWIPWYDEKYYINTTPLPYDKAQEVCQKLGGDVVSFDTIEEQAVISQLMVQTSIITTKYKHVYIGNRKEDDVFKWARTGTASSLQNWCPGEPSGGTEECTEYLSESNCYNDIECSKYRASICEVDLHPNDRELWEKRRYFLNRSANNYQSASTQCNEMGMELATISSQYENEVAIAVIKSSGYSSYMIYIGYDDIDTEGKYAWKSGSSRAQTNGFEFWDTSSTFNDNYDCTVLRANIPDWYSVECINNYFHLCEIDAEDDYLFIADGASNMEENRACVQGHAIKEVQVRSLVECLKVCIDEPECLSVNYYSNIIAHDVTNCQLNHILKSNYPGDVLQIESCNYYEFK